jgi:5'-deoxynucleotidase YfbR-like HD superfamily hydrolase
MQCYTGRAFFPFDPRPEDVHPLDVAHHLGHKCRFNGAVLRFYSVAEHSVRASHIPLLAGRRPLQLAALLHDAPEAYGPDVVRPWKIGLALLGIGALKRLEQVIAKVVGERFSVDLANLPPEVKHADLVMLATERRDLMAPSDLEWHDLPAPLEERIKPWSPREAELRFLERYIELTGDLDVEGR